MFPKNSKQPISFAMFSCCFSGRDYEDDTQHEAARPRPPSDEMSLAPKPATGLRKRSDADQKRPTESATPQGRRDKHEVKPTDYLYFGEGSHRHNPRYTTANSTNQQGGTSNNPTRPAPGNPSGRDHSGNLATGLSNNNSKMGYNNLTYGGSLQFNYAGTQPGFGP